MIRVKLQPEPEDFDERVRQRGLRRLRDDPSLASNPGRLPPYWRESLDELHLRYSRICAYLGVRIEPGVGDRTVDHFVPKSVNPELAYEWSNYRLACSRINSNKGTRTDVLDPFTVEDDWFRLEMSGLEVLPGASLLPQIRADVERTIEVLKLNDSEFLSLRSAFYDFYLRGEVTFVFLKEVAPFLAREISRQGLIRGATNS